MIDCNCGEPMSVTDKELNDDRRGCEQCGRESTARLCVWCRLENVDLYSDMKIQDAKEAP
jgi:hypothetical protein